MEPARTNGRRTRWTATRWDVWLPLSGLVAAVAWTSLAVLAEGAFRDRHELALEGRYLRLAHALESELREDGPEASRDALARAVAADPEHVAAIALLDGAAAREELRVGDAPAGARAHDVDLFLGRSWAMAQPFGPGRMMGMRGRRTLRIFETPAARHRPLAERLLLPAAAAAALVVVALSLLGGRLLVRRQEEARREAARRRLEGLGRAGAGLAHQLRTPLATIKGSCQLLLEDAGPAAARRLAAAVAQSERMERLVGQLLDYARPPEPEARPVPLGRLCDELAAREARLELGAGGDLVALADEDHLRQILDNLAANALAASPEDARVELAARRRGGRVEILVLDRGDGPGDDPEALFEPYVTRRADGTGLGLPIARALAEANGGELVLAPRDGGGTRAVLTLPAAGEAP